MQIQTVKLNKNKVSSAEIKALESLLGGIIINTVFKSGCIELRFFIYE